MKLYKRGTKWYADLRREGLGRVATGATEKDEARRIAKRLVDGGAAGKTLAQALERSLKEHYAGTKGYRNAVSVHRQVLQELGGVPLEVVSTLKLRAYADQLHQQGNSPATINRKLSHIQKTLRLACEWGWLDNVPVIPRRKEAGVRHRELSAAEEQDLMVYTAGWFQPLVVFLLETGCRLSEALKVTEVDRQRAIQTQTVVFRDTKSGKDRAVPLTTAAANALWRWSWNGKTARQCQKEWDKARVWMNLQNDKAFVIHCLRHTCASRLLQGGEPIEKVSKWLGHATISVTQRYAHLRVEDLRTGVAVLECDRPCVMGPGSP